MIQPHHIGLLMLLVIHLVHGEKMELCYGGRSRVCAQDGVGIICDNKTVIYLKSIQLRNNPTPCDDRHNTSDMCRTYGHKQNNTDYDAEVLRRCSVQTACSMFYYESITNNSVVIFYKCLDNVWFDPCNETENVIQSDFSLLLSSSFERYASCSCRVTPLDNSKTVIDILDIRLRSHSLDTCSNNRVIITEDNGEELVTVNCSDFPLYNKTISTTNSNVSIDVRIEWEQRTLPEMIWIQFRPETAARLTCSTRQLPETTTQLHTATQDAGCPVARAEEGLSAPCQAVFGVSVFLLTSTVAVVGSFLLYIRTRKTGDDVVTGSSVVYGNMDEDTPVQLHTHHLVECISDTERSQQPHSNDNEDRIEELYTNVHEFPVTPNFNVDKGQPSAAEGQDRTSTASTSSTAEECAYAEVVKTKRTNDVQQGCARVATANTGLDEDSHSRLPQTTLSTDTRDLTCISNVTYGNVTIVNTVCSHGQGQGQIDTSAHGDTVYTNVSTIQS